MSFLDNILQGAGAGIATALATSGEAGPVDVSGSDSPNTGDVLTATNSRNARWLPPAGGGSGGSGGGSLVSHFVYALDEAGSVVNCEAGAQYLIYGAYQTAINDYPRAVLPNASDPAVNGKLIRITFFAEAALCSIALAFPLVADETSPIGYAGNMLIFEGLNTQEMPELVTLPSGTYECRALTDPTGPYGTAIGMWVITQSPDAIYRMDLDIDYVMPGPLPSGWVDLTDTNGMSMPTSLNTAAALPFDGVTGESYAPGQIVLVHLGSTTPPDLQRGPLPELPALLRAPRLSTSGIGVYVVAKNAGTDWQLRALYHLSVVSPGTYSQPRYFIRSGTLYGGRAFRVVAADSRPEPPTNRTFELEREALAAYPGEYASLDGTDTPVIDPESSESKPYMNNRLLFGKVNKFRVHEGDITFTIQLQLTEESSVDPGPFTWERVAMKCVDASSGMDVIVNGAPVADSFLIEDADGNTNSFAVFPAVTGLYVEWILTDGVWRIVSCYIPGPGGLTSDAEHGNRGGGSLHPIATDTVPGFMSTAHVIKVNAIPPPSSWSVATNLNPKHWWRADNTVQTGGLVDSIADNGTGGRPFAQAGAARAPIAVDGDGKTYLALDGVADFYIAGSAADWTWLHNGSKMWTLFVVMQPPTISAAGTHQSILATMNYSSSGIGMFVAIGENGGDAAGFPANWYNEAAIYGGGARQSSIWNQSQQDTRKGVFTFRSLAYNSQVAGVDFTSLGAEFQTNRQARTLQIWKGDQVVTSSRSPSSGASSYFNQANPAGALRLSGFTDGPRLTGAKVYEILLADRVFSERDTRNYIYYAETKYNLDLSLSI
jgi:hypothetical protein